MSEPVEVDLVTFFREVHLQRGSFTKFEVYHDETNSWQEINVWPYRSADLSWWLMGKPLFDQIDMVMMDPDLSDEVRNRHPRYPIRITRYPDLEKDVLDIPYLPSVASWMVDTKLINQFFENGTVPNGE